MALRPRWGVVVRWRRWRAEGRKGVRCVSRRNCSRLITRLRRVMGMRLPTIHSTVTRTHSGNSLDRGFRCRTTGHRRNGLLDHVDFGRGILRGTHIVSGSQLGDSAINLLDGVGVAGLTGGYDVDCIVMGPRRTSLRDKGVSVGSPVTGTLLNGGTNSRMVIGMPTNLLGFHLSDIRLWLSDIRLWYVLLGRGSQWFRAIRLVKDFPFLWVLL